MSDCSMGGRRFYNVPTHTPAEDRLEITVHFEGEFNPHPIVLNRLDREVDYVEVDGERFERVRECKVIDEPDTIRNELMDSGLLMVMRKEGGDD